MVENSKLEIWEEESFAIEASAEEIRPQAPATYEPIEPSTANLQEELKAAE